MDATITVTGNVGTAVEFHAGEGWAVARFRMASTPRFVRDGQWVDGNTTWLSVRCSQRLAEHAHRSLTKGDPVVVWGRLRTQSWTDSEGQQQDRIVIEATAIGHDLAMGTTMFTKRARPQVETSDAAEDGSDSESGQASGSAQESADEATLAEGQPKAKKGKSADASEPAQPVPVG